MTECVPMTVKRAKRLVFEWHRHLPDLHAGLFAVGLAVDGEIKGVAVAGTPPQEWEGTGRFVISRVAVVDVPNGCSMLYGAICRAAKALGYREAWTYTLPEEPGTSLRAAGFEEMGMTKPGEHHREKRPRKKAVRADAKKRWRRVLRPADTEGGAKK